MKIYSYSKFDGLPNALSKVALMTFVLNVIFIAVKLPFNQFGFIFVFLIASQIVAFFGSIFIGLPVGLLLTKLKLQNSMVSALICGAIIFLIIFFYLNDGKLNSHNFQGSFLFSIYGVCCGYAFMQGYQKGVTK